MRKYFITFLALLTVLAISCNNRPTQAGNFATEDSTTDISDNYNNSSTDSAKSAIAGVGAENPVIAVSGDNVILFYSKTGDLNDIPQISKLGKASAKNIYHRGSANGGLVFSDEYKLASRDRQNDDMISPQVLFEGTSVSVLSTSGDKNTSKRDGSETAYNPFFYSSGSFSVNGNVGKVDNATWKYVEIGGTTTGWYTWVTEANNTTFGGNTGEITLKAVAGVGRKNSGGQLVIPVSYSDSSKSGVVYITQSGSSWTKGSSLVSFANEKREGKFKGSTATTSGAEGILSAPTSTGNTLKEGTSDLSITYSINGGGFETYYDGTYTYIISGDKLYRGQGTTLSEVAKESMTITGAQGGSVAVLSDGSILTFTKESGGLVFRKIKTFTKDKTIQ